MTALPTWAATPEGRALCEQIIADRPEWFLRRYDSGYGGEIIYKGKTAAALRKLHDAWVEAELAKRDARWNAGETPTREESPFAVEDANALIHRILREADEGLTTCVGDPLLKRRAA